MSSKKNTINNLQSLREPSKQYSPTFALFAFAFRPFFLFAALFSIIHLLTWVMVSLGKWELTGLQGLPSFLWHGHEMVFGYGFAVVIGFLLTAVTNWTGLNTMQKTPLFIFFSLWVLARAAFLMGGNGFYVAAVADISVAIWFVIDFSRPIVLSKNKRQYGFIGKVVLLAFSHVLFYLGLFGFLESGEVYGVYLGFYLMLAIVLAMGARVIPFFIQRGLGIKKSLKVPLWISILGLVLFSIFTVWAVFFNNEHTQGLAYLSLFIFALYNLKLIYWFRPGLFKEPLLWVLWVSNFVLLLGFLLYGLSIWGWVSMGLAIHAFAIGGIGMMTMGMMSRVSLGHTGRNIFSPPRGISWIFLLLLVTAVTRIALPWAFPAQYSLWLMISVTLWSLSFALFIIRYAPILMYSRVDGKEG